MMITSPNQPCYVLLSEGLADRAFLKQLTHHWIAEYVFYAPFPNDKFFSVSMFHRMLSALRADKIGFPNIIGIILVADACDTADGTFNQVRAEIAKADWKIAPVGLGQIAFQQDGLPPVVVITLPAFDEQGGLETLYAREIANRNPELDERTQAFLFGAGSLVGDWNSEKQGKARFAAMIAGSHQDDPSRAASAVFRHPSPVQIEAPTFAPVAAMIRAACASMARPI